MMNRDVQWLLEEKYGGDASAPGFAADKERLAAGEPLAYVIGFQPFLGLRICLDSRPLIPRSETEWWTERCLQEASRCVPPHQSAQAYSFLDLCAGSGAIGCAALERLPNARVYFGELDSAHEATIQKNIRENRLDAARSDVRIGDLFAPFANMRFDIIAANPPYIPADRPVPASVANYEPPGALFAGSDGLDLVRRMVAALQRHLAPGGTAWIEIDHTQIAATLALAREAGLRAEILSDQYKTPRILVVSCA